MKRQKPADIVHTMPAPRRTQSRMPNILGNQESVALNKELKRLTVEHTRSYEAAKQGRLLGDWLINPQHINDDIMNALFILRGRSRELYQNNPHVQNYFKLLVTHVIGPDGYTAKSRVMKWQGNKLVPDVKVNEAAEYHWKKFCEHGVCDVTGRHSMSSLLALALVTVARDGEALLLKRKIPVSKKNPYGIAWQLVSIERLDISYNRAAIPAGPSQEAKNAIVMGVEMDQFQRPVVYHLQDANVIGVNKGAPKLRQAVPAEDIIHLYVQSHAEQMRGVPWLHAVMKPLHQLQQFEDYTLVAARVGAAKTGFFVHDGTSSGLDATQLATGMDENGELIIDAEPGMFQALPVGWKFQAFTPDYPAATYAEFVKSNKRSIANGTGIGYNTLFGDLSDVNYSSIRQDLIATRDMWKVLHKWLIENALEPMYEAFIAQGLISKAFETGTYVIPKLSIEAVKSDYVFHGRSFPQIDPKADADAYKMLIEMGVMSNVRFAEIMGEDPFAQMEEQSAFRDFIKEKDLFVSNMNDPEANADRADAKAAADAQAKASELAAKTASEAATQAVAQKDTADKEAQAETKAELRSLKRDFDAVSVLLRVALERASEKPLQLMSAPELMDVVAEVAPVVEEPTVELQEPAAEPEVLPEIVVDVVPEVIVDPVEELEAAVESLEATVAELEAEVAEQKEAETADA